MYMRALMWKDFRQQRPLLVASGIFLLVPYVIAALIAIVNQLGPFAVEEWTRFFIGAALADIPIAGLLIGFFAGNAFAGERADQSAEFLAYLPIPRNEAVASKAVLTIGIVAVMMTACMGIFLAMTTSGFTGPRSTDVPWGILTGTCVLILGVAWLGSSLASSGTYAAAAGIAIPLCCGAILRTMNELNVIATWNWGTIYAVSSIVLGLLAFVAGVVYYLRRFEP